MNTDATRQRFSPAGRTQGSLWVAILAAAWMVQAVASLAAAEPGDEPEGKTSFEQLASEQHPTSNQDRDCPYLRVALRSPHGPAELDQKPLRELLSTSLSRVGFEVVDDDESHYWWASSLVLDNGSELAWSTVVRSVPEIRGGGIRFTTALKEVEGKPVPFSGMHSLRLFRKHEAREAALKIADGIAQDLLPAVYLRCDKAVLAATRKVEAELERVRGDLIEEMKRVRQDRSRSQHEKALELEVGLQEF